MPLRPGSRPRSAGSPSGTTRCGSPATRRSRWSPGTWRVRETARRSARWSRRGGSSPSTKRSRRRRSRSAARLARTSTSCSAGTTSATQSATYAITVNPLVNWIWFGFAVMALGTGLALLPETRVRVRRREGAGGRPTTTSLLLLFCCCRLPLLAQARRDPRPCRAAKRSSRRQLEERDHLHVRRRRPMNNCGECRTAQAAREPDGEAAADSSREGKDREQVIAAFIAGVRRARRPLRVADRQGLQSPRVVLPVPDRRDRRRERRARRVPLVAPRRHRRSRIERSRRPATILRSRARLDDELRDLD